MSNETLGNSELPQLSQEATTMNLAVKERDTMSESGFKLAEPAEMRKAAINMIALMKTLNELQRELAFGRALEPADFDSLIATCQTVAVTTGALCEQVAALKESVRTLEARSLGLEEKTP